MLATNWARAKVKLLFCTKKVILLFIGFFGTIGVIVSPAEAYLDPGTGTMVLQGIIAALVGGFAIVAVKYTQLKQFLHSLRRRPAIDPPTGDDKDAREDAGSR